MALSIYNSVTTSQLQAYKYVFMGILNMIGGAFMLIKGRYGEAVVFTDIIEDGALSQIKEFLDQDYTYKRRIRIMPDVHEGAGCVIGLTADLGDVVVPNLVGVDIGCGMLTVKLEEKSFDYRDLDKFIRQRVPAGTKTHRDPVVTMPQIEELLCYKKLKGADRFQKSIGTLGGGNHFIEVGRDSKGNHYLVIHSGSRNMGKQIADYYQKMAVSLCKDEYPKPLCCLRGQARLDYMHDMRIAQDYAWINRQTMAEIILKKFFKRELQDFEHFHTVHNYIDPRDNIIRKGAVSAYEGEEIMIPINMRDGSILAVGLGNEDWNYSAPHGAGRLMSRRAARDARTMKEFIESMEGIYTTSVSEKTLDESPFAYKPIEDIIERVGSSVRILERILPVYNFKA